MKALAFALAALAALLAGCAPQKASRPPERPPGPVTLIASPPFAPEGAPARPSAAEAAAEGLPGVALAAASDDASLYRALCGGAQAPDVALAGRHPTPEEIAACAGQGVALTSVQLAGSVRPEDPSGAFLVYDAAQLRPEARPLVESISENRVALFDRPGYAELLQVRS